MKHLICEGPCNPQLSVIDADVKAQRKVELNTKRYGQNLCAVTPELVARLRTLQHTWHQRVPAQRADLPPRWVCLECGHGRFYGWGGHDALPVEAETAA